MGSLAYIGGDGGGGGGCIHSRTEALSALFAFSSEEVRPHYTVRLTSAPNDCSLETSFW